MSDSRFVQAGRRLSACRGCRCRDLVGATLVLCMGAADARVLVIRAVDAVVLVAFDTVLLVVGAVVLLF